MEKYYLSLLNNTEGLGKSMLSVLLARFANAGELWQASLTDLKDVGVPQKTAEKIIKGKAKITYSAQQLADICYQKNVNVVALSDKNYPHLLAQISKPPFTLFFKGSLPVEADCLAMVGSRKASSYGLSVSEQFAADLARSNFLIVSGGAKGIDTAAHKGTLAAGGRTIAVFGCGIDVIYPKENNKLFEQIVEQNGALVSEYLPGTKPIDWHFPMRNRIISGLAKGVLVVEADKKSGSLITARFAVDENREVYCVPGSIYSTGSIGVHNLIKQGAILVDRPEDILSDLGSLFRVKDSAQNNAYKQESLPDDLSEYAQMIYQKMIVGKNYAADEIIMASGLDAATVSFSLLELEMSGRVEGDAGVYQRKERGNR